MLAQRRDGRCHPRSSPLGRASYIQARWRVALSPVPVPKPGAVPALIPSDGHREGAEGRDELEPPLHLGHAGTADPLQAAAGGGPRAPREVTEVGWGVGLEAMRKLVPLGGHTVRTCHPLPRVAAAGARLGTGSTAGDTAGTRLGTRLWVWVTARGMAGFGGHGSGGRGCG